MLTDWRSGSVSGFRVRRLLMLPHLVCGHLPPPPAPGILWNIKKVKGSPYSITERRVPELIPVLGSHPAGDVSHKPGGRLPLLSARPAVTPATLQRAATSFVAR